MQLEARIVHVADTGHEWCAGADDRNESRQDDGLATVPFKELLCAAQILDLEQTYVAGKRPGTHGATDRVVGGIAEDRCRSEQREGRGRLQRGGSIDRCMRTHGPE